MKTKDLDVVYFLRSYATTDELRYSLRSLKNLPHRDVYFVGAPLPTSAWWQNWQNVRHVYHPQIHGKWQNTADMLNEIWKLEELSDEFILMNDDFFILKPLDKLEYFTNGLLSKRVNKTARGLLIGDGKYSGYGTLLNNADLWLKREGYPRMNYEVHCPFIYNKKKLGEMLKIIPAESYAARRSLYGNIYSVGGKNLSRDVKIADKTRIPGADDIFCSTSDTSFSLGKVGRYLRRVFEEKSPYET